MSIMHACAAEHQSRMPFDGVGADELLLDCCYTLLAWVPNVVEHVAGESSQDMRDHRCVFPNWA
jgi:hypothetical protein